ncbi:hypothetical protein ILYODFUR_014717 [Ilyodon furcidens]|uniref:Uncharacterized protein n=1 Tax=Ilyodon furcidens TaxID=33524 RepID=A0ABV0T9T5_9TELE
MGQPQASLPPENWVLYRTRLVPSCSPRPSWECSAVIQLRTYAVCTSRPGFHRTAVWILYGLLSMLSLSCHQILSWSTDRNYTGFSSRVRYKCVLSGLQAISSSVFIHV